MSSTAILLYSPVNSLIQIYVHFQMTRNSLLPYQNIFSGVVV